MVGLRADRAHDVPPGLGARPSFTTPMSERLLALSVEYLVPGIGVVPDNTLGLLEANRAFVEAFLAGLNHELGREFAVARVPGAARRDLGAAVLGHRAGRAGRHRCRSAAGCPATALGDHQPDEARPASLVLLIKGALPRRYPDLRVYAVEAAWRDGKRREKTGRRGRPAGAGRAAGARHLFYGFALTEDDARGQHRPGAERPGWFFVLEEQPRRAPASGSTRRSERFRGAGAARLAALSWSHLVDA